MKISTSFAALVSTYSSLLVASGIFSLYVSLLWEKIVVVVERLDYSMWCFWNFLCSESSGVTSWCKLTEKKEETQSALPRIEERTCLVRVLYAVLWHVSMQHFNLWFALSDFLLRQQRKFDSSFLGFFYVSKRHSTRSKFRVITVSCVSRMTQVLTFRRQVDVSTSHNDQRSSHDWFSWKFKRQLMCPVWRSFSLSELQIDVSTKSSHTKGTT